MSDDTERAVQRPGAAKHTKPTDAHAEGQTPWLPATVAHLQRSVGNRATSQLVAQRRPSGTGKGASASTFKPTFGGNAGIIEFAHLNSDMALPVTVKNARSAKRGATMMWMWGDSKVEGVEPREISPATGERAVYKAKAVKPTPMKAADELGAQVEVTEPGETPVTHPVKPALRVGVMKPEIEIQKKVVPGPKGGGSADNLRPGDVLEYRVTFGNTDKPKDYGDAGKLKWHLTQTGTFVGDIGGTKIAHDAPFEGKEHRWDGDILVYSVYCNHAGNATYKMDFDLPGTSKTVEHALKAETSLAMFLERCGASTDRHRAIVATFDAYLHQAFMNYKAAYDAAETAFKEYADRQKLTNDILLGILFAGLGGAAGGAVGGLVKFSATQKLAGKKIASALQEAGVGALTDAAKDIVKYTVRLKAKLGGGKAAAPSPDDATPDAGKQSTGKTSVAGSVDPLNWYASVQKAKSQEEAKIATVIENWKTDTIDAINRGSNETVDFDPINAVTEITKLDGDTVDVLSEPPSPAEYEKNMWEAWIENYAYTVETHYSCGRGMYGTVGDNVGKELKEEMERVAKKLAEKGVDSAWLTDALNEARQVAQKKANRSRGF